jgi:hypothetical protein
MSGVVQGSVLGPLLFLLYANDVTSPFDADVVCKLYADDVKLYSVVQTTQVARRYWPMLQRHWPNTQYRPFSAQYPSNIANRSNPDLPMPMFLDMQPVLGRCSCPKYNDTETLK